MNSNNNESHDMPTCSFCGKRSDEVDRLIHGPNVYICNECVALCGDIVEQDSQSEPTIAEERLRLYGN